MPRSRSTASRGSRPKATSAAGVAIRIHEATGSSARSWTAAVADALRGSKGEVTDPLVVEVVRLWADLGRGRMRRYHASVKIAHRQELVPPAGRTPRGPRARRPSRAA